MTTLPSAHRANGLPPSAEHHGTCSSRAPREVRPEKVPAPFRVPVPPRQGRAAPFPWRRAVSANRERRSTGGASRRANGERRCCGARWQRARRVSLGPSVRPRAEMGGGGSTRRVTFEADENENITVVKGVRLSDSVIDRMKEPSSATGRQHRAPVSDEELKKRIAEELALERARRDSEAQKRRLKQEQMYVRDEFGKLLERERISSNEHLTRAILRERAATEEERQKAQHFARQLEEKDRELRKHDAYYKEQLARLEERSAQFYKVTTEQYQKAADEVSARFKRYESHPICGELQDKILQCYREHAQETLSCSALASQYLRCVNHAKQQRMLGRGG